MVCTHSRGLKIKEEELIKQFADIKSQIEKINGEILGYNQITSIVSSLNLEEKDLSIRKLGLSIRKLGEYQSHLRSLQKEKETLHSFMRFFSYRSMLERAILGNQQFFSGQKKWVWVETAHFRKKKFK
ncbi:putative microtubule-associated protein, MAP65/Ase1/PRC1 [Helianthus anomalus]